MIRITTNGVLNGYKYNLMRSTNALTDARNTALTQRNFNSYSEDPAAATQAFQLRRSFYRTSAQLTNSQSVTNKYQTAWSSLNTVISDLGDKTAKVAALKGISDATASGRQSLGDVLSQCAESVVQDMNVQYDGSYIFAGADGLNVPFTMDADGNLLYRGYNVNAAEGTEDYEKLKALASETNYVDIGLGLEEAADGSLITSSAFNASISGVYLTGYGVDEDGDPKNIVSLMKQLGDIFSNCDEDGNFKSAEDQENAERLTDKLSSTLSDMQAKFSELDTRSSFLSSNHTRLTKTSDTLNEEIIDIEQCDLAEAITSYSWAQYCYNAALKVGNSILSQSLIDYMS